MDGENNSNKLSKMKDVNNNEEADSATRNACENNIPMDKLFCAYMLFAAACVNETLKQQKAMKKIENAKAVSENQDENEQLSIRKPVSSERSAQVRIFFA